MSQRKNEKTLALKVRLSPKEVISRIMAASDEERLAFTLSGYAGDKPFLLKRSGNRFRIQKRRFHRNNFQPYLFATVEPTKYGSRITGYFAMGEWVRVFMMLWFIAGGLFGCVILISLVSAYLSGDKLGDQPFLMLIAIGMLVLGYLIVGFGKLLSRNEADEISQWLRGQFADEEMER